MYLVSQLTTWSVQKDRRVNLVPRGAPKGSISQTVNDLTTPASNLIGIFYPNTLKYIIREIKYNWKNYNTRTRLARASGDFLGLGVIMEVVAFK